MERESNLGSRSNTHADMMHCFYKKKKPPQSHFQTQFHSLFLSNAEASRLILGLLLCLETQYHLTKNKSNLLIRMENVCVPVQKAKIYYLTWTGNRFPLVLAPALTDNGAMHLRLNAGVWESF